MAAGYLLDTNVITLIAATAIGHGLTLVTRNTRDVESIGVPFIDPWQAR